MQKNKEKQRKKSTIEIQFESGTLIIFDHLEINLPDIFPWLHWDQRGQYYRCHAYKYRDLIRYQAHCTFD